MSSKVRFSEVQNQACGPRSMVFDRYHSKNEIFALRRILNDYNGDNVWLPIKKKKFTTTSTSCEKINNHADLLKFTEWTSGDPKLESGIFTDEGLSIDTCSELCLVMRMDNSEPWIEELSCTSETFTICRNSSGTVYMYFV